MLSRVKIHFEMPLQQHKQDTPGSSAPNTYLRALPTQVTYSAQLRHPCSVSTILEGFPFLEDTPVSKAFPNPAGSLGSSRNAPTPTWCPRSFFQTVQLSGSVSPLSATVSRSTLLSALLVAECQDMEALGSDLLEESMEILSKYDFLRETHPALASHEAEGNPC